VYKAYKYFFPWLCTPIDFEPGSTTYMMGAGFGVWNSSPSNKIYLKKAFLEGGSIQKAYSKKTVGNL
jgi:hypothetical protein